MKVVNKPYLAVWLGDQGLGVYLYRYKKPTAGHIFYWKVREAGAWRTFQEIPPWIIEKLHPSLVQMHGRLRMSQERSKQLAHRKKMGIRNTNLRQLAREVAVKIQEVLGIKVLSDLLEYRLMPASWEPAGEYDRSGLIRIKETLTQELMFLTMAHELGHFLDHMTGKLNMSFIDNVERPAVALECLIGWECGLTPMPHKRQPYKKLHEQMQKWGPVRVKAWLLERFKV